MSKDVSIILEILCLSKLIPVQSPQTCNQSCLCCLCPPAHSYAYTSVYRDERILEIHSNSAVSFVFIVKLMLFIRNLLNSKCKVFPEEYLYVSEVEQNRNVTLKEISPVPATTFYLYY